MLNRDFVFVNNNVNKMAARDSQARTNVDYPDGVYDDAHTKVTDINLLMVLTFANIGLQDAGRNIV